MPLVKSLTKNPVLIAQWLLIIIANLAVWMGFARPHSHVQHFEQETAFQTCFSPKGHCEAMIVASINQAERSIVVASYSFTSRKIARALTRAQQRGIQVRVLSDKSQFKPHATTKISTLISAKIPLRVDAQVNIAHNKYILIDHKTVETGSFNFTVAANHYNAENVIIIHSKKLASIYECNWQQRFAQATPSKQYHYQPTAYWRRSHQR